MLLEPIATPVATPPALIVAAAAFEEIHVAELVRFCVVPSLKVPVAVNWSVVPFAIDAWLAVIVIDCNVAAVTVSARVFELTPLCVAITFALPIETPRARPLPLMVAIAKFEELQPAELVKF